RWPILSREERPASVTDVPFFRDSAHQEGRSPHAGEPFESRRIPLATPFPVDPAERPIRPVSQAWAWGVHLYTASGAVGGMLALQALVEGRLKVAMLWLCAACFVDATDGFLARRVRVWEVLPHIDGRKLDDIVDYFTYVIIPVAFMAWTGLLPP